MDIYDIIQKLYQNKDIDFKYRDKFLFRTYL